MKSNIQELRERLIKIDKEQGNYVRISWFSKILKAIEKDVDALERFVNDDMGMIIDKIGMWIDIDDVKQLLKGEGKKLR